MSNPASRKDILATYILVRSKFSLRHLGFKPKNSFLGVPRRIFQAVMRRWGGRVLCDWEIIPPMAVMFLKHGLRTLSPTSLLTLNSLPWLNTCKRPHRSFLWLHLKMIQLMIGSSSFWKVYPIIELKPDLIYLRKIGPIHLLIWTESTKPNRNNIRRGRMKKRKRPSLY